MLVNVQVKPGSKKGPLVEAALSGELVVYLNERPHDGEANKALIKMLAEYFGVAKSCVAIKAGEKTRKKVIEIIK